MCVQGVGQITRIHESGSVMFAKNVMFAKFCHLSAIHLNVTTVYFHPGVSVSPQTTSCYVLIKVFAKREERDRRYLRPRMRTDTQRSENNRECLTVLCV